MEHKRQSSKMASEADQQAALEQFEAENRKIQAYLTSNLSQTVAAIIITKNDSIQNRVEQVLEKLEKNGSILIGGRASGIAKAVAVAEITKQKVTGPYAQYNKVVLLQSTVNPNYKAAPSLPNPEKEALDSVRGPQVYLIPVMYILFVKGEGSTLSGWTHQS